MRQIVLVAILILAVTGARADELAPDWTHPSTEGIAVTLSELAADQPVILLFWATWCPYCKALMPHLQSIQLEHASDVKVLALHFRDDKGDPVAFIRKAGYDFMLLPESEGIAKLYDVWGTPGVILIDRNMKVRLNLYDLPSPKSPEHVSRPGFLAPFWAAEIRKTLQAVLAE